MKRLSFKIVFIVLSMILISGCSGKSVKSEPENFQFQVNDTWIIKKWFDTSGNLKITRKIDSKHFQGILTVTYVDKNNKLEKLKTVKELLEISVDEKSIKMLGKEVTGSSSWSLDNFVFNIQTDSILKGTSSDGRGNGGEIILSMGEDEGKIDTEFVQGTWNLSKEDVKTLSSKAPIKSIKINFDKDALKIICVMADKKMVLDLIFICRWKMHGTFAELLFTDFDLDVDLDYQDPEIQRMEAAVVQQMKESIKARQGEFKAFFENRLFDTLLNKPVYFNLVKINSGEIELRKEADIFRIRR